MTRRAFPGGWYCDALPSGEYAVLLPQSHLETHQGRVALPNGDQPLYHRITNRGGFQIAGQGHSGGVTWWWSADHGWVRKPAAVGISPVIFNALGDLQIATPEIEARIGSQGWRYVAPNGALMTGDATYGVRHGLNEWTDLSDAQDGSLLIGQEHEGAGAVLWDGAVLRMVEPGACRFIRAAKSGDTVSVATWKEGFGSVVLWLTVAELAVLPIYLASTPAPTPVPQPHPAPEPTPVNIPNQLEVVTRIRAKYPTPLGAQHAAFLIETAQLTNAKLLRKESGTRVQLPDGRNVSQDILMFGNQGVDILSDGEGAATPAWGEKGVIVGDYIDVSGLSVPNSGTTVPNPGTPAPSGDLAGILKSIEEFRLEVAALAVRHAQLEGRVSALESDLNAVSHDQVELHDRVAQHGDAVEVTGSLSWSDVFASRKVTWTGKIK